MKSFRFAKHDEKVRGVSKEFPRHEVMPTSKVCVLRPNQVHALAKAEGLVLVKKAGSQSGYKAVYKSGRSWQVQLRRNGECKTLGFFATPEEAALEYAHWSRRERSYRRSGQAWDEYFGEAVDCGDGGSNVR